MRSAAPTAFARTVQILDADEETAAVRLDSRYAAVAVYSEPKCRSPEGVGANRPQ